MANFFVMNTTIIPNDGLFHLKTISEMEAKHWIATKKWISAVGHPATARVISDLLDVNVPADRIQVTFEPGDEALVFKLDTRLPEGKVLTVEELQDLPFSWKILKRIG